MARKMKDRKESRGHGGNLRELLSCSETIKPLKGGLAPQQAPQFLLFSRRTFYLGGDERDPRAIFVPERELVSQGSNLWLGPTCAVTSECVARTCLPSVSLIYKID